MYVIIIAINYYDILLYINHVCYIFVRLFMSTLHLVIKSRTVWLNLKLMW